MESGNAHCYFFFEHNYADSKNDWINVKECSCWLMMCAKKKEKLNFFEND